MGLKDACVSVLSGSVQWCWGNVSLSKGEGYADSVGVPLQQAFVF